MVLKKIALFSSILSIVLLSTGCGENKLDISNFTTKINDKTSVPEICKVEYKTIMPRVAVVDFTNNSTYGKASINDTKSEGNAYIGIGTFGAGAKVNSRNTTESRKVDSKISESVVAIVETMINDTGGVTLVSRADMDKIDEELKLQDSGLLDPDSVVQMGELTGAQIIVTGSINNVEMDYTDNSAAGDSVARATSTSDNDLIKYGGALLSVLTSVTDGMDIKTTYTVRIVDVATGKILLSEDLEGSTNIGKVKYPTFDQVVGAIKKNINDSLPKLEADFSKYFAVKGYITQLRTDGDEIVAQINIGSKQKVEENQEFSVYSLEENEDPISGKISCDRFELPVKLRATNQIMGDKSWVTVEEGDAKKLKLYQLVQKSHKKVGD